MNILKASIFLTTVLFANAQAQTQTLVPYLDSYDSSTTIAFTGISPDGCRNYTTTAIETFVLTGSVGRVLVDVNAKTAFQKSQSYTYPEPDLDHQQCQQQQQQGMQQQYSINDLPLQIQLVDSFTAQFLKLFPDSIRYQKVLTINGASWVQNIVTSIEGSQAKNKEIQITKTDIKELAAYKNLYCVLSYSDVIATCFIGINE